MAKIVTMTMKESAIIGKEFLRIKLASVSEDKRRFNLNGLKQLLDNKYDEEMFEELEKAGISKEVVGILKRVCNKQRHVDIEGVGHVIFYR